MIIDTPDLLRWYQNQRTWDVVLDNEARLIRPGSRTQSSNDLLAKLLMNVRRDLGEISHGNAAEYVVTRESFDFGGTGTTVVNEGIYAEYEKKRAEREARELLPPRAILLKDPANHAKFCTITVIGSREIETCNGR